MKTRLVLQIVFCVLSVLSVASVFFLGAFLGWVYALIGVALAVIFGLLMLRMKGGGEQTQGPDFSYGEEENEDEEEKK